MRDFHFVPAAGLDQAAAAAKVAGQIYIGGGTDLMQLMKDGVQAPDGLIDLPPLLPTTIAASQQGVTIGAGAAMADVATHPDIHARFPVLAQALLASASPQVRNMATIGGNLLQRTRCRYFRDTGFACNKRDPGSGCPALQGENRDLAIFGTSQYCIATHPSDMAVAMLALDATLDLLGPNGARQIRLADLHREPEDHPEIETNLLQGEAIRAVILADAPVARRSVYLKVRDRTSFAFAMASAAVGLQIEGGVIRQARIAVGGVATKPWRLPAVEAALAGQAPGEDMFRQAAAHAADGAKPAHQNGFKVTLLRNTVARALALAAA